MQKIHPILEVSVCSLDIVQLVWTTKYFIVKLQIVLDDHFDCLALLFLFVSFNLVENFTLKKLD